MSGGLQPFMLRTGRGTLLVQSQLRFPPGYIPPAENAYPGIPGNVVSRDNGATWQVWNVAREGAAPPAPSGSPFWDNVMRQRETGPVFEGAAVALRAGPVLIQEWTVEGPDASGKMTGRVWESHDDLQTLRDPVESVIQLPQSKSGVDDQGRPYAGLTFHRSLIEMPDGELLACGYCWFKEDTAPSTYRPQMLKFRTVLLRSSDRARTWRYDATIAVDPSVGEEGFNEPVLARVSRGPGAGRLVCVMRTGSNDCPVYQSHSDDEGASWSRPRPLELRGVDPELIELSDGRLACLVGRRMHDDQHSRRGYFLALSEDAGDTWTTAAGWNAEPHANIGNATYYSSLRELEPRRLLAVYDVGYWSHPVRYIASRELHLD